VSCNEVREALPAYVDGAYTSLPLRRHLAECEGCRSELARYERLLDAAGRLVSVTAEPPPGLLQSLLRIPAEASLAQKLLWRTEPMTGHLARYRAAYVGGLGFALAGAAGAALWRSRTRRLATA
jgi:predicted anti-sigma-YlaC factor YlaD